MRHPRSCMCCHDSHNKRQQILDAAFTVFSRKGYHRATVDEIIALADTGKGTVYNYFVNKEQLFYTLIKERSAPFESLLEKIVTSPELPLEKVEHIVKVFLDFYIVNAELWRVLMHEVRGLGVEGYSNFSVEQRDKYQAWFCHTIGMIEKVLLEGQEQGVILPSCNAHQVSCSIFSVIITAVFHKFVSEDINETARAITELVLHGVANK